MSQPGERDADAPQPTTPERLAGWVSIASGVVAPATVLSALLFYFGYVSSRAQFRYFGLDVDTIGLGTRDYVMRSPQALLVPFLALSLAGAAMFVGHLRLEARPPPPRVVKAVAAGSGLLLLAGVVLVVAFPWVGDWPPYPLVTPLLIAVGTAVTAYTARLTGGSGVARVAWATAAPTDGAAARAGAFALALVVVVGSLFWATATVAEWTGRGVAMRAARDLSALPPVILDTRERLYLTDGVVTETALPAAEGQVFRYRYRGLRLLVQGADTMFLVPDRWTPSNSTVVVPLEGDVRVRFQFQNDPPLSRSTSSGPGSPGCGHLTRRANPGPHPRGGPPDPVRVSTLHQSGRARWQITMIRPIVGPDPRTGHPDASGQARGDWGRGGGTSPRHPGMATYRRARRLP